LPGSANAASPNDGLTARSIAAMAFLAIVWGLSIPATKLALETVPPMMMTAMRFLVAVPLLLFLAWGQLRVPWRAFPSIVGLGVMGITFGNVGQSFGIQGTSASAATIISATIPVFIVVFAAFRLKQRVTALQWLGLLAAFGGIALVAIGSGADNGGGATTTMTGVAWMLVSAIAIAFYYIWSSELSDQHGTRGVTAWNNLAGFATIVPMAAWEMTTTPYHITATAIWVAIYLGTMVTGLGILLWLYLLRTVPARIAASVQYLQPVFGIAASAALFGDRLGPLFIAGVVLIFTGLALAVANPRKTGSATYFSVQIKGQRSRRIVWTNYLVALSVAWTLHSEDQ
jgi:O-acetylserine/cysteine efflux transporter